MTYLLVAFTAIYVAYVVSSTKPEKITSLTAWYISKAKILLALILLPVTYYYLVNALPSDWQVKEPAQMLVWPFFIMVALIVLFTVAAFSHMAVEIVREKHTAKKKDNEEK